MVRFEKDRENFSNPQPLIHLTFNSNATSQLVQIQKAVFTTPGKTVCPFPSRICFNTFLYYPALICRDRLKMTAAKYYLMEQRALTLESESPDLPLHGFKNMKLNFFFPFMLMFIPSMANCILNILLITSL